MMNPLDTSLVDGADSPPLSPAAGLRKLVRPRISDAPAGGGKRVRRSPGPLLTHQETPVPSGQDGSHAELFYFQKQMQAQTPMVFVLDDGERIEGVVEWFDLHVIKVRHITRTMIYKSSIKYLYKASDITSRGATPR